jgi:EamA domain-containing membrane protein RarD
MPRPLLKLEGLAVAIAAVTLYFHEGYPWWLLLVLALAPDLAMVGYVAGTRAGSFAYNAVHTYVGPVLLATIGVVADADTAVKLALIWLTHIGVDRAVGYGLKYPGAFKDTHLQRV